LSAAVVTALVAAAGVPANADDGKKNERAHHVPLISVDGLHQQDLAWYVGTTRTRRWPGWPGAA
jgi:hypothetical protein